MKYLLSLLLGLVAGAALFIVALLYNPFGGRLVVSPLALSGQPLIDLSYSAVPGESIAFVNDGESIIQPYPDNIAEIWEPTVKETWASTVLLTNALGAPAGIGFKFSSNSERTRLLESSALVESVWHVYLPGRGTFFVDQTENYWSYIRDVILPARWSPSDSWRGNWNRVTTIGPNALGTGRVTGAGGEFAGMESEAVELLTARAYSADHGPVSMSGNLTIAIPVGGEQDSLTSTEH